ncbi:MAG: ATP-binding protein [Thainema sp.]
MPNSESQSSRQSAIAQQWVQSPLQLAVSLEQKGSLRTKIMRGYVLALGIAVFGTTTGLIIGNQLQQRALAARNAAARERQLVNQLQVDILYNRPAKQLSPYLQEPQRFRQESRAMIERIDGIQQLLRQQNQSEEPLQLPGLQSLLTEYEQSVQVFSGKLETAIAQLLPMTADPAQRVQAEQTLLNLVRSPEFVAFIEFPDQLVEYNNRATTLERAAETNLLRAETLRMQIIILSLVMSSAIAFVLALRTSRIITQPLQQVTSVAQQAAKESNFDLRADVYTQDEVETLAQSLNQLIERVKVLLAEQRAAEAQLVHSEKMSSLGQLVGGVAHEVNNPVNFIHGNLNHAGAYAADLLDIIELYQQHYPQPADAIAEKLADVDFEFIRSDLPKLFTSMQVGTDRIRKIIASLRTFARLDEAERKTVDIHEGIDSTLMILRNRLKVHQPPIQVEKHYGSLPLVECFPSQLNQVFMNILMNAVDALESCDRTPLTDYYDQQANTITISTSICSANGRSSDEKFAPNPEVSQFATLPIEQAWVEIQISDTGSGIPANIRTKLFDPFFTTKPVGKGTGLGLSISHQIIVDMHRGQLDCESTPGRGAAFIIRIPVRQPKMSPSAISASAPQPTAV